MTTTPYTTLLGVSGREKEKLANPRQKFRGETSFAPINFTRLRANLIQAQRNLFFFGGAHTYQQIDRDGTFHTQWE